MDIKVLDDNPIYKGHTFRLKFTFSNKYPIGTFPNPCSLRSTVPELTDMVNRTARGPVHRTPCYL